MDASTNIASSSQPGSGMVTQALQTRNQPRLQAAGAQAADTQDAGTQAAGTQGADAHRAEQPPADRRQMEEVAQALSQRCDLKVEVVMDDKSDRYVLKVMSPDGKRLLYQYPAEAVLKLAERLRSGASQGLLASLA